MSIVIVMSTKDRLVGMSDSRAFNLERTQFTDDVPKVFAKGPYLFTMGAMGGLAYDAWRRTEPQPGEPAASVAERMLQTMTGRVTADFTGEGNTYFAIHRFGDPTEVVAISLRATYGQPRLDILDCQRQTGSYVCLHEWAGGTAEEHQAVVTGELTPCIDRCPSEAEMLTVARTTIASVAAKARSVGGPVHAVVIDGSGMRWTTPVDAMMSLADTSRWHHDTSGVRIGPASTNVWDTGHSYGFTVADGVLGLAGYDNGSQRGLHLDATWTGAGRYPMTFGLQLSNGGGTAASSVSLTAATGSGTTGATVALQTDIVQVQGISSISLTAPTVQVSGIGAYAGGDRYVTIDASGHLHISAIGPGS